MRWAWWLGQWPIIVVGLLVAFGTGLLGPDVQVADPARELPAEDEQADDEREGHDRRQHHRYANESITMVE